MDLFRSHQQLQSSLEAHNTLILRAATNGLSPRSRNLVGCDQEPVFAGSESYLPDVDVKAILKDSLSKTVSDAHKFHGASHLMNGRAVSPCPLKRGENGGELPRLSCIISATMPDAPPRSTDTIRDRLYQFGALSRSDHQRMIRTLALVAADDAKSCTTGNEKPAASASSEIDKGQAGSSIPSSSPGGRDIFKLANLISIARALSGPLIGYFIVEGYWAEAFAGIMVAGASDWADGYIARNWNQSTVLGSYLDPLADKVVVTCVVGALAWSETLPPWLEGLIVGRDVALVGASFLLRAHTLGWRWKTGEFFRTGKVAPTGVEAGAPAARFMKPALVSKVNTALQFLLVSSAVLHEMHGVPDHQVVMIIGYSTAATTAASLAVYAFRSRNNRPL